MRTANSLLYAPVIVDRGRACPQPRRFGSSQVNKCGAENLHCKYLSAAGVCASCGCAGEVPTSCGTVWLAHVSKWRTQPDVLQRSQQEITTAHLQNLLHWRRALDFCLWATGWVCGHVSKLERRKLQQRKISVAENSLARLHRGSRLLQI